VVDPQTFAELRIADDARLYIIGDIHGRLDLLNQMVKLIDHDLATFAGSECVTVTIGDYIDRGLNSRGVLDRLAHNPFPTSYVALKGNHEAMLQYFLKDASVCEHWRHYGGMETLYSYGVPITEVMAGRGFDAAARALNAAMPDEHLEFLASLWASISIDAWFLCHAGIRPGVPLNQQQLEDLLWIRDEFLSSDKDFSKMIIHGHSPNQWPEVRPNRVNIDTGAFATGRLTCLVIENGRGRFLFTA
jgi:serine/threonine protein phosphatase 1